jgi:hypothetical protein
LTNLANGSDDLKGCLVNCGLGDAILEVLKGAVSKMQKEGTNAFEYSSAQAEVFEREFMCVFFEKKYIQFIRCG